MIYKILNNCFLKDQIYWENSRDLLHHFYLYEYWFEMISFKANATTIPNFLNSFPVFLNQGVNYFYSRKNGILLKGLF